MREIKFRAWDKKNSLMLDWSTLTQSAWNNQQSQLLYSVLVSLKPDYEIMQFTGLKDKEGKEIYEGDVGHDGYHAYKIVFHSGCFALEYRDGSKLFVTDLDFQIDIIGNIHQNPELLN